MGKGKKFDAAQKHFEKKELELRKTVRHLEEGNIAQARRIQELEAELEAEKARSARLQAVVDEQLKMSGMEKEKLEEHMTAVMAGKQALDMLASLRSGTPYGVPRFNL